MKCRHREVQQPLLFDCRSRLRQALSHAHCHLAYDSAMTATPTTRIIAGRYEVTRLLGRGTFGEVYEVVDLHLKQICALKLLETTPFGNWAEAQILRQVHGEFVLPVLNADLAAGRAYVVTELAMHGTVADQIISGVGIPLALATRWTRQACQGVARIHDHRLLHGDIKPENLFLNSRKDALVGDLGLAQLQDENGMVEACGSKPTMAPEVARVGVPGQAVPTTRTYGVGSDVYSLGASLFWMLAGAPPIPTARTNVDVWEAPQPDLWEVAPHVPQGVRDIVNRAIARDPRDRYASPADLDAALGGRTLPPRVWTRVTPHSGHEQCFVGDKSGASQLQVCVSPTGKRTRLNIEVRHTKSDRAVRKAGRTVLRSSLASGLRGTFHACG